MKTKKIIGFIKMNAASGYARDFSPDFIKKIDSLTNNTYIFLIEKKFGDDLGFNKQDYQKIKNLKFVNRKEILRTSNIIVSITSPKDKEISMMKNNSILIAMLHLDTHPERKKIILKKKINAISLDDLKNKYGKRIVQDYKGTALNGVKEAFIQLKRNNSFLYKQKHLNVYILGKGNLAKEAIKSIKSIIFSNFKEKKYLNNFLVIKITDSGYSIDGKHKKLIAQLNKTKATSIDLLIDASKRNNPSVQILDEIDISKFPKKCVILDLSADCYDFKSIVKGIQGLPTGNESKYIFEVNDPEWNCEDKIPKKYQLKKKNRRLVVSHYAWPSYGTVIDRIKNIKKYEKQLLPVLIKLLKNELF